MAREKFDPFNAFNGLDKFVADLDKLRKGFDLLQEVHLTLGAYGDGDYTKELRGKVNDYFGFDDSE